MVHNLGVDKLNIGPSCKLKFGPSVSLFPYFIFFWGDVCQNGVFAKLSGCQ